MGQSLPTTAVHVVVDDEDVADTYNERASAWRDAIKKGKLAVDRMWQPVATLVAEYGGTATGLRVRCEKGKSAAMRRARELAAEAMGKHAFCRLCRRNYGRPGAVHDCHPVCYTAPCRGERFDSLLEHERHMEERHPIALVYPENGRFVVGRAMKNHTSSDESSTDVATVFSCPACKESFVDLAALAAHVESTCPEALAQWVSQTKIVKL